jgi:hypothetical protein
MPRGHQEQAVSQRSRPDWIRLPAIGRLGCRVGWWSACGWGSGMPASSGQIPPPWAWWENEAPTAGAACGPRQASAGARALQTACGAGEIRLDRRTAVRGALPLREEVVRPERTAKGKGKEVTRSLPLSMYSAPGGLRQDPGRVAESPGRSQNLRKSGIHEVRVLLSTYGPRGTSNRRWDSRSGCAHGAEVRCAPRRTCAEQLAEMQPC